MLKIGLALLPIFLALLVSEVLWRKKILRGEAARKTLHIIIGSYVASWPFYIPLVDIQLISIALLVVVAFSHRLKIFHAIIDIKRASWGDMLYAVGIGLTATLTNEPWIFAIAILHMSLCDGLAGLLGNHYGKNNQFKILGQPKSIVGTVVFAVSSFIVLLLLVPGNLQPSLGLYLFVIPVIGALIESVGVYGTDNVMVPLVLVYLLNIVA
ncbi:hypothetical protein KC946_00120 [Candidatus Saccharibacteria bacterium]|nr:hypothetical protein [Candidatus Saccharibacteria bacterium]